MVTGSLRRRSQRGASRWRGQPGEGRCWDLARVIQESDLAGVSAMRLPRMTTRRWMVVVAVVAPILCAARLLSLSAMYRDRAYLYEI